MLLTEASPARLFGTRYDEPTLSDGAERRSSNLIMALRTEIELLQDDKAALYAKLEQARRDAHETEVTIQNLKLENEGLYESVDKAAEALETLEKDIDRLYRYDDEDQVAEPDVVDDLYQRRDRDLRDGAAAYRTPESIFRRKLHPPGSAKIPLVILTSSTAQPQILSPAPSSSMFSPVVGEFDASIDIFAPLIPRGSRGNEDFLRNFEEAASPIS